MHAPKARTLHSVRGVNRHAPVAAIYDLNFFRACGHGMRSCRGMGKRRRLLPARGYAASVRQQSCRRLPRLPRTAANNVKSRQKVNCRKAAREAALGRVRAKKLFSLRSSPPRHYDSHACLARQSRRFLEIGSLHPPSAALYRFPCAPLARALRRSASLSNEGQRHSFETFTNCLQCDLLTM